MVSLSCVASVCVSVSVSVCDRSSFKWAACSGRGHTELGIGRKQLGKSSEATDTGEDQKEQKRKGGGEVGTEANNGQWKSNIIVIIGTISGTIIAIIECCSHCDVC